jgi:hypothetical protein
VPTGPAPHRGTLSRWLALLVRPRRFPESGFCRRACGSPPARSPASLLVGLAMLLHRRARLRRSPERCRSGWSRRSTRSPTSANRLVSCPDRHADRARRVLATPAAGDRNLVLAA